MKIPSFMLVFAAMALVALGPALAQAVAPVPLPGTTISGRPIVAILEPYIMSIAGAVATALAGFLTLRLNKWFGLNDDEKNRRALQSALMTGTAAGLNYLGKRASDVTVDVRNEVVAYAINYAIESVPSALAYFGLKPAESEKDRKLVADIASAKLQILAETPSSVATAEPAVVPGAARA